MILWDEMIDRHTPESMMDLLNRYRPKPLLVDVDQLRAIVDDLTSKCIYKVNGVDCEAGCLALEICGRANAE